MPSSLVWSSIPQLLQFPIDKSSATVGCVHPAAQKKAWIFQNKAVTVSSILISYGDLRMKCSCVLSALSYGNHKCRVGGKRIGICRSERPCARVKIINRLRECSLTSSFFNCLETNYRRPQICFDFYSSATECSCSIQYYKIFCLENKQVQTIK